MTTHTASLGAVLSMTTGTLVASVDETFALQDFLVGRPLMTHERIIGADEQTAALLLQFPRLAEAEAPDFSLIPPDQRESACRQWVAKVAAHVGFDTCEVHAVDGLDVDPGDAFVRAFRGYR